MSIKGKSLVKANYQLVLFVFIAFLAMVLVSYFYASGIVQDQMHTIGLETMNSIEAKVASALSAPELSFANVVQTVESMLATQATNEEILVFLKGIHGYFSSDRSPLPDFMKIYGFVRGEFLDGSDWVPPDDYVPESRPWHIGAEQNTGGIFFSEPYIDADTGGIVISFSQKVFGEGGAPLGVMAIDLNLTRIVNYVASQQISNNGYGVMLSDSLTFSTHRDSALVGARMMDAGEAYARLATLLQEGKPISAHRFTDLDGTDSIAFFRTVFNGWPIGVIIPRASYYRRVYELAAVLGVLGFALMSALSYILVRMSAAKIRSDEESRKKSNFLANMSHEIRTPLNAIIGMTEIARMSNDREQIGQCLEKVNDASVHLLGVINDILDMSRIDAGKIELSETDFRFDQLLRQVTNVVAQRFEEKGQRFTVQVDPRVPEALITDRHRLAQVLTSLLSNAGKFTPEGGEISLDVRRLADVGERCTLQFEVKDNGIGISREQQARLFRPFEQADGSISRKYGGTGLGLVISKRLVEMMGGAVQLKSELGLGSTFGFTIRAGIGSAVEARPARPAEASQAQSFEGKRLLLVEDVEINREIVLTLLDGAGFTIDCAENGLEACAKFGKAQGAYDMIFMDIHMPEMDGYEATRRIRASACPTSQTVPIVAMTANVFKEDIEKCLASGMNDHIGKPLEPEAMLAKLRRYLLQ